MNAAAGPFAIAASLLAVGGVSKLAHPADTATALRGVGVPVTPLAVRIGGAAEGLVGVTALLSGDRVSAALVAFSYLAFAAFVGVALRREAPLATCGCLGGVDTPPSVVHLAINLGAAGAALVVAIDPGVGLMRTLESQPLAGVPYALLILTGVYLAIVAITALPRTLALVRASRSD